MHDILATSGSLTCGRCLTRRTPYGPTSGVLCGMDRGVKVDDGAVTAFFPSTGVGSRLAILVCIVTGGLEGTCMNVVDVAVPATIAGLAGITGSLVQRWFQIGDDKRRRSQEQEDAKAERQRLSDVSSLRLLYPPLQE